MELGQGTLESVGRLGGEMENNFWQGKHVLVTGATGLVGSHVSKALISKGAEVIAFTRSRDPRSYFFTEKLDSKAVLAYGDIVNFSRVSSVIDRYEVEVVFHLAAQPIVGTASSNPMETFHCNVMGTLNVLEAIRNSPNVKSAVIASSDKAYGKSNRLPYTEDMPMSGEAPYEASKSCADLLSLSYAKTYGLPIAVTRFGNIYGPGDLNFSRIVPGAIRAALRNETLEIRSDGKMMREYLYVEDVVSGYLLIAEKIKEAKGEAFNFGSGERLSVLDVVEKVSKAVGKKIETNILNIAKNEIPQQYLSSEKAKKILGWKAELGMDAGLKATIPWYKRLLG